MQRNRFSILVGGLGILFTFVLPVSLVFWTKSGLGREEISFLNGFVITIGAFAITWSVFANKYDTVRPITPFRATLIPLQVLVMVGVIELVVSNRVWYLIQLHPPARVLLDRISVNLPMITIGSSMFTVVGSSIKYRDRGMLLTVMVLILITAWFAKTPYSKLRPLFTLVTGSILGYISYWLSNPIEPDDTMSTTEVQGFIGVFISILLLLSYTSLDVYSV